MLKLEKNESEKGEEEERMKENVLSRREQDIKMLKV